ncbi:hypothetical protein QOT17_009502 [Balamuthia mandrillaris]
MSATANNVSGSCLGWTTLFLLFLSLISPWYLTTSHFEGYFGEQQCTMAQVFLWAHSVCSSSGDCEGYKVCQDGDVHAFWGEEDNHFTAVYAPTFVGILLATLVALALTLFFSIQDGPSSTSLTVVKVFLLFAGLLGLLLLTAVIVYFGVALPRAWKDNVQDAANYVPGPWDSLLGQHTESPYGVTQTKTVWTPAGWWVAILAWPFFLGTIITLGFALRATSSYTKINDAGYALLLHN